VGRYRIGWNRQGARWTEPTGGALVGDDLVHIATGQWDRFGDGGYPNAGHPPRPTEIRILPLSSR
jgi:hypothetical protein